MTKESWYKEILYTVIKQNITHSDQKLYLKKFRNSVFYQLMLQY